MHDAPPAPEALGVLELTPTTASAPTFRTFTWIPNGPIMRYVTARAGDYFDYPSQRPGESMRIVAAGIDRCGSGAGRHAWSKLPGSTPNSMPPTRVLPLADWTASSTAWRFATGSHPNSAPWLGNDRSIGFRFAATAHPLPHCVIQVGGPRMNSRSESRSR